MYMNPDFNGHAEGIVRFQMGLSNKETTETYKFTLNGKTITKYLVGNSPQGSDFALNRIVIGHSGELSNTNFACLQSS